MILEVKIPEVYQKRFLKQEKFEFAQNERLVLLYGANGVGKSSLLNLIANNLQNSFLDNIEDEEYYTNTVIHDFTNKIPKIHYWKASEDTPLRNPQGVGLDSILNFSLLYDSKNHSEGESIQLTFQKHLEELPDDLDILLIDELDSGLGANMIHVCLFYLTDWLKKHPKTQCFMSINNYHWIYLHKTIYRMDIGEFQDINNYEEFWNLTRDISMKLLDKNKQREE